MKRALVIDDEAAICRCFESVLLALDCQATVTASAEEGLRLVTENPFDVIVLDVRLPGIDGTEALPQLRRLSDAPIIVMTAHGTLSTAVSVIQEGAFEYLPKPFELDHVTRVLERALASSESLGTSPVADDNCRKATLIGSSLPMQHLFRQIALAAQHDAPVLITGESGTGKELVAQAVHQYSERQQGPLVPVHLASLNEPLLERELFGHTVGAYTGAETSQRGLMAQADGGTLFLDEVGETPLNFQVKLLRCLESHEFYPVGSSKAETSDFRLIAATNRPPDYLRNQEFIRQDFYYRLATIHIHLPPLRDHLDDIPELASHFLRQHTGNNAFSLTDAAVARLQSYSFPGNVRELRNIVIRAASESASGEVDVDAIQLVPESDSSGKPANTNESLQNLVRDWASSHLMTTAAPMQTVTGIVESALIESALKQCNGNRSAAAKLLGIHRETLREKLNRQSQRE